MDDMNPSGFTSREKAEMSQVARALAWAQGTLELTDSEVGSALGGVSVRTVARWRERSQRPQPPAVQSAETLVLLSRALHAVFGDDRDRMQAWLHEPLPALRDRTPLRTITHGDAAKVVALLANADAGVFE
jgi:uncharacterized protein (DUF2384 family)